ncbi:hypothetical protein [Deinococcus cellulosilyticus]|uniref:Uncharacterized protein n=1 Tax=Deinococcus cellulosilyticus (strain DSM 18568 / NBRC 106333 / KACC 11606 / 5516J-15) TaxID=1223518 RepID=A0A511N1A9_DEIC1|nr:hypothetical protein [Deinococcus cellulosilyticus]GEM46642.1 hypothetical protein DC3_22770 [Deinococcus cellulosilyticus NBRC 106333 = KACC 11606]
MTQIENTTLHVLSIWKLLSEAQTRSMVCEVIRQEISCMQCTTFPVQIALHVSQEGEILLVWGDNVSRRVKGVVIRTILEPPVYGDDGEGGDLVPTVDEVLEIMSMDEQVEAIEAALRGVAGCGKA